MNILERLFMRYVHPMNEAAFGISDPGRGREANEDSYLMLPEHSLYAVADGMGGHKAGEVASSCTVKTIHEYFTPERSDKMKQDPSRVQDELMSAVKAAHDGIRRLAESRAEYDGMGSTIALAFISADVLHTCHVGDSRVYVANASGITRVTADHSEVWELVRAGAMSAEEARFSPLKNKITQALGAPLPPSPGYTRHPVNKGDRVLLCSDGLWDMLPEETIHAAVTRGQSPRRICRDLIALANRAGGEDNITVIVVQY